MSFSPNRVVAIGTPLIFAPLAGAVTAWAAKHAPGVELDSGQLQAIFIAGATIAVAKAGLWMKGWQDYEKNNAAVLPADAFAPANDIATAGGEPDLDDDDDDVLDDVLDDDHDDLLAELEPVLAAAAVAEKG